MSGVDTADVRFAVRTTGALERFNRAGVLAASDVHVASRLGAIAGEHDESVLLAAALAVRAPRLAHVCVDLTTVRTTATSDLDEPVDVQELPWPQPDEWARLLAASALVVCGPSRSSLLRIVPWLSGKRCSARRRRTSWPRTILSSPAVCTVTVARGTPKEYR